VGPYRRLQGFPPSALSWLDTETGSGTCPKAGSLSLPHCPRGAAAGRRGLLCCGYAVAVGVGGEEFGASADAARLAIRGKLDAISAAAAPIKRSMGSDPRDEDEVSTSIAAARQRIVELAELLEAREAEVAAECLAANDGQDPSPADRLPRRGLALYEGLAALNPRYASTPSAGVRQRDCG
jgi:hypothetical protein